MNPGHSRGPRLDASDLTLASAFGKEWPHGALLVGLDVGSADEAMDLDDMDNADAATSTKEPQELWLELETLGRVGL